MGVPSPPPPHNFDAMPVVHGRDPLWEPGRAARSSSRASLPTRAKCSSTTRARCGAGSSADVPDAVDLAVRQRGGDDGALHRLDLHAVGRGRGASVPVAVAMIALVLAEARREPRRRAGAAAMTHRDAAPRMQPPRAPPRVLDVPRCRAMASAIAA